MNPSGPYAEPELEKGRGKVRQRMAPVWLARWLESDARPIPIALALAGALALRGPVVDPAAPSPKAALAQMLASRGLACEVEDVQWISRPWGLWESLTVRGRALVRAHTADEPNDLYSVDARLSPEGEVLSVGEAHNLTETGSVDESRPVVRGRVAAYLTTAEGLSTGLHVLDLGGRPMDTLGDLTRLQRVQAALTNLQRTGQTEGVVHDTFALEPVARRAAFTWRDDGLVEVRADDRLILIDPLRAKVISGDAFVQVLRDERSRPGSLVTWAVDRVRAMPSFGDDRMQWLKAVVFTALDHWQAQFSNHTTAQEVQDELGLTQAASVAPAFTDAEIGWPPAPMKTAASQVLPGEGQWIALDQDPFITPTPSAGAAAFVTSFVRPNAHRQDVRVYVTLWDPRQIALHIEAGTVEPVGASGEHGPGLVPRAPEVIKRLVAGFNGGFQAQHGEYGMQANGIEYLPPKPYAATVAELRDGSDGFGAWPPPAGGEVAAMPEDIVAMRQNLTALVQDGKFNPWGRTWWGGTPPGWADQIHATRSAICLTSEGFVGYFYSASISADDLAQGMLEARCAFGIHLDMNPGHAGFEFYHVAADGRLKPLGRPLQSDWEAEGRVPDMSGYLFRSRRMIRGMGHMLFPRYIQREARDFFYLTARPVLPGAPIDAGPSREPDEGVWRTKGLPQHGFPYALATTWVRAGSSVSKLLVLRVDPRAVTPAAGATYAGAPAPTVLSLTAGSRGALSLWWHDELFSIGPNATTAGAAEIIQGVPFSSPLAAGARAAVGVQDEDGVLTWVELPPEAPAANERTARALDALLERVGCSARMGLLGDARALLGGSVDLAGAPVGSAVPLIGTRLSRARAPDAHLIFETTPIVPSSVWQPLQAKRVRYFYKPAPLPLSPSGSASAGAPATPGLSTGVSRTSGRL